MRRRAGGEDSDGKVRSRTRLDSRRPARHRAWHSATRTEELSMSDKSPRQSSSKKSGKTLKQKRAEKKSATAASENPVIIPTRRSK
jgi:hypothetical protein